MFSLFCTIKKNINIFFISIICCLVLIKTDLAICAGTLKEIGIITVSNLNLRPKPVKQGIPLKSLERGSRVEILAHKKGWLKVLHEGSIGYVRNRKKYIHIIHINEIGRKKGDNLSTVDLVKNEAENINRKIEQNKTNLQSYTKKEAKLVAKFNRLERSLNDSRKKLRFFRKEIKEFEKKIDKIEIEYNRLNKKAQSCEDYILLRLVALYKLDSLGGIYVLASSDSIYELYQRKRALERILSYDEDLRKDLMDTMFQLQRIKNQLISQNNEKLLLEKKINDHIILMSHEQVERSKLLDEFRNKRSLTLASLSSLRESAKALDNTIKSLHLNFKKYKPDSGVKTHRFSSLKGSLQMPVKGKVVNFFGPYTNTKFNLSGFHNGIDIKGERGEPVRAVSNGKILFAKWFKGYGNLIIIDHGEKYYTLYAHTEEIFIVKGDTVEGGDVVATVGDAGSKIGPGLYFEIRHHGKPINPLKWIRMKK